jgi:hypothetical protein
MSPACAMGCDKHRAACRMGGRCEATCIGIRVASVVGGRRHASASMSPRGSMGGDKEHDRCRLMARRKATMSGLRFMLPARRTHEHRQAHPHGVPQCSRPHLGAVRRPLAEHPAHRAAVGGTRHDPAPVAGHGARGRAGAASTRSGRPCGHVERDDARSPGVGARHPGRGAGAS